MSLPRCYSCRKRIDFAKNRDERLVPVDVGAVRAVIVPRNTAGRQFLVLLSASGLVERCRLATQEDTEGVLLGWILHRSTCKAQGVPRS